jgi:hypothetical protein
MRRIVARRRRKRGNRRVARGSGFSYKDAGRRAYRAEDIQGRNEGQDMAEHTSMDYAEHEKTYKMFLTLTKWGTISIIVLLALMAFFLV